MFTIFPIYYIYATLQLHYFAFLRYLKSPIYTKLKLLFRWFCENSKHNKNKSLLNLGWPF